MLYNSYCKELGNREYKISVLFYFSERGVALSPKNKKDLQMNILSTLMPPEHIRLHTQK